MRTSFAWFCASALAVTLCSSGCSDGSSSSSSQTDRGVLGMTEHEETAVLDFVNDPATTVDELDDDVGLDSRAAGNIVIHRNGFDEVYPSGDDNPFDTIAELDGVPYVGPTALEKLRQYVANQGTGSESVEGVEFSADQAAAVVWGVNQATVEELDVDVALTSTAADNLIDNRPYTSVGEMGSVPYVGPSALAKLRDYAAVWAAQMPQGMAGTYDGVDFSDAEAATALEVANAANADQLADAGITTAPRNVLLDNRPWATLATVADFSGIGPSTMQRLKDMVATWTGPVQQATVVSVAQLVAEAETHGTSSQYYDQLVTVGRAIITSEPDTYSSGAASMFVADPQAGTVQALQIYVDTDFGESRSFLSWFDDIAVTGRFTLYNSTWEILIDESDGHALTLNNSGLGYPDYLRCIDAWSSTAGNPEGAVLVESSFDYRYMVPLPIFKDHPMYSGLPDPGNPDSAYPGHDHPGQMWCGDQAAVLAAWLATQ
jgi:DNA uptake protein ComE-like DNA-binding protein